jgi:methylglutamate dehydrogenase subunit D
LIQVSGWPESFPLLCERLQMLLECRMPDNGLAAVSQGQRSIFRVGPERLWIAGPSEEAPLRAVGADSLGHGAIVTEIGDSRTVVRVAGTGGRVLLNRGLPVDLDAIAFPPDAFAQSVIQHIPVLVHRVRADGDAFDVYVTRDYAVSFWEWLTGAALSLGCEIREPG